MTSSGLPVENSFESLGIKLSLFRGVDRITDQSEHMCWDLNPEVHINYFTSPESKILNIVCYDNFLSIDCSDGLSDQVSQAVDFLLNTMYKLAAKNSAEFHEKNTEYTRIIRHLGRPNATWEDMKPY